MRIKCTAALVQDQIIVVCSRGNIQMSARLGRMLVAGVIAVSLGTLPGIAAEKKKGEAKKAEVRKGPRERIDCMVGTEDRQARIAIEAYGGKIHNFAWYGKTK